MNYLNSIKTARSFINSSDVDLVNDGIKMLEGLLPESPLGERKNICSMIKSAKRKINFQSEIEEESER